MKWKEAKNQMMLKARKFKDLILQIFHALKRLELYKNLKPENKSKNQ